MKIIGEKRWREWIEYDNKDKEGFYMLKEDTPAEIKKEYKEYKEKIKNHRKEGFLC